MSENAGEYLKVAAQELADQKIRAAESRAFDKGYDAGFAAGREQAGREWKARIEAEQKRQQDLYREAVMEGNLAASGECEWATCSLRSLLTDRID